MEEAGMESNYFDFIEFNTPEKLVAALSSQITCALNDAIEKSGQASIAFSGGSTPKQLLETLSYSTIAWHKVRVTLVDERWVETLREESNEKLIREHLLKNKAQEAIFMPLKINALSAEESVDYFKSGRENLPTSLDVVVLGMGLDGHTASFFPHTKELDLALSTTDLVCATTADKEPKERITLSRTYLLKSHNLFLHIEGREKKEVFLEASHSDDTADMPIISMMQQTKPLLKVYYAD
jgi:6-phosphogluconolactonase